MKYILYNIIKVVGRPIYKILYRPRYIGVNNIPKKGAVILAGNHTSQLDAAMMVGSPNRLVHMLAKKELFNTKIKNWYFRSMACIPVDRKIHDDNAKNEAIDVLNNGGAIGLFPEGTVNRTDKTIMPFKYGAVSFAKKTNAYLVPFAITGKYKLFKKSVKITYGKPYKVTGDLEKENQKLMDIVEKMIIQGERENEK